jgi:hypothetical protein
MSDAVAICGQASYHPELSAPIDHMHRKFEYKGRLIQTTVLPEQGRWAYRIDGGETRMINEARVCGEESALYAQAEAAAKAEIDGTDRRSAYRAERDSQN